MMRTIRIGQIVALPPNDQGHRVGMVVGPLEERLVYARPWMTNEQRFAKRSRVYDMRCVHAAPSGWPVAKAARRRRHW